MKALPVSRAGLVAGRCSSANKHPHQARVLLQEARMDGQQRRRFRQGLAEAFRVEACRGHRPHRAARFRARGGGRLGEAMLKFGHRPAHRLGPEGFAAREMAE
jgi:hypothetical protein